MRTGARLLGAVEVLTEVLERHRPATQALADWGRAHRFAGSGDRSAIGTLVFDALRQRQSIARRMDSDSPRALILGAAKLALGLSAEDVEQLADGSQYALSELEPSEKSALERWDQSGEDDPVDGDIPDWLLPSFERAFGERAQVEGAGLARRAPVDLRVNTLKATPEKVLNALRKTAAEAAPLTPIGVRIPAPAGFGRSPNVEAETAHGKGWFEIQDAGSQVAALLTGAGPRMQVLDLCAGAGGKTLALSAMMQNTGQIYAYDSDKAQLRPIFERLKRAGARNVQVIDAGDVDALEKRAGTFDIVLVDAPCTGTGTWRRRPEAKWRLKPENLEQRCKEQAALLDVASRMVKPGGRMVYVTCSVLPQENSDCVASFIEAHKGFSIVPFAGQWDKSLGGEAPNSADGRTDTLLLTPAQHGTDGFFVAIIERDKDATGKAGGEQ